jgi:hypothetical protein
MGALLDVLGALLIGTMLMMMMVSFQYQLQDTAQTATYAANMLDHMDTAAKSINGVIALAGIGMEPATIVINSNTDAFKFRSYWNYITNELTSTMVTINIELEAATAGEGKVLVIRQNDIILDPLGYILWVDELNFKYYDINDQITTTAANVRAAEAWLTFKRDAIRPGAEPLRTKLQVKCFLMNAYMRGG